MKILWSWLREFVDIDLPLETVADKLTEQGLEVEAVVPTASLFDKIVVGEVRSREPTGPDSHLLYCEVAVGNETYMTVCGDSKISVGQRVPVALPGAVLGGVSVRPAEVAGVRSEVVLCSLYDLGLRSVQDEVVSLSGEPPLGSPAAPVLGLEDTLLEIELTPNRGDCMSILGVAREVAAATGRKVRLPEISLSESAEPAGSRVRIDIEAQELCPVYVGRMVEGVKVSPSPVWLAQRLKFMGIRPINNVVDVANYVMFEFGQPLHTFDHSLLAEGRIVVRRGRPDEPFEALDGTSQRLSPEILVIADAERVVAVAGIMGGESSGVTEKTDSILIESAHFDPVTIRKGARGLGLPTEASIRFERGIDPAGVGRAADRAAGLLAQLTGGTILAGRVQAGRGAEPPKPIQLRVDRANAQLGLSLRPADMAECLERLKFEVSGEKILEALPPSFRNDVTMEADLVEEVARIYGYSRIPGEIARHSVVQMEDSHSRTLQKRTREVLCGLGLDEIVTATLWEPGEAVALGGTTDEAIERLRLRNPFSQEQSVLRPSLIPGVLAGVRVNVNRRREDVRLFEIGTVFTASGDSERPAESVNLAAGLTGVRDPVSWGRKPESVGFFDMKGILENYFQSLRLAAPEFLEADVPMLERGHAVRVTVDSESVGFAGRLEPDLAERFGIRRPVHLFELVLDKIVDSALGLQQFRSLPKYPAVSRDLAVVVGEEVPFSKVTETLRRAGEPLLVGLQLFDVYRGKQIPAATKSLAYSLTFRSEERTLRDEEVDATLASAIDMLKDELSARLRLGV